MANVACVFCPRRGRYRIVRLAARYGPEAPLDQILADIAGNCQYWRPDPRPYEPRCGARFEDLVELRPQDLPGQAGTLTKAVPREEVPLRRHRLAQPDPANAPRLSSWSEPRIGIHCKKCGREEVHETLALRTTMGNPLLTYLHHALTSDCPKRAAAKEHDWCGAKFVRILG